MLIRMDVLVTERAKRPSRRSAVVASAALCVGLSCLVTFCASVPSAKALNIDVTLPGLSWIQDFRSRGLLSPFVSQTALLGLANTAADYWESRLLDARSFEIQIGFLELSGALASARSGLPDRALGTIAVDASTRFFVDPTPLDNSEYTQTSVEFRDLGGGLVNTQLAFAGPTGPAAEPFVFDLFTVLLHEIGHTLGVNLGAAPFENGRTSFRIEAPLPFAGSVVPILGLGSLDPGHLNAGGSLLSSGSALGVIDRNLPSDIDILAVAQLGGFHEVVLNSFQAISEPGPSALFVAGFAVWLLKRRLRAG